MKKEATRAGRMILEKGREMPMFSTASIKQQGGEIEKGTRKKHRVDATYKIRGSALKVGIDMKDQGWIQPVP